MRWVALIPFFSLSFKIFGKNLALMQVYELLWVACNQVMEKLKDPNIAEIVLAMIGGKSAPLLTLENQDAEIDSVINSFNTAVTETANDILGKHRPAKKPWVTYNIPKL